MGQLVVSGEVRAPELTQGAVSQRSIVTHGAHSQRSIDSTTSMVSDRPLRMTEMSEGLVSFKPADTLWFAAFVLPLYDGYHDSRIVGSSPGCFFHWPVCLLLGFILFAQAWMLRCLHPIIWGSQIQCRDGSEVLHFICTALLVFAAVAGDLADSSAMWEYVRCFPHGSGREAVVFQQTQSERNPEITVWRVKEGMGITWAWRAFSIFLIIMRVSMSLSVLCYGATYIAHASADDDAIKDSMAFLILMDLDDIVFKFVVPRELQQLLSRVPELTCEVEHGTFFLSSWLIRAPWVKPVFCFIWVGALQFAMCYLTIDAVTPTFVGFIAMAICYRIVFSCCKATDRITIGELHPPGVVIGAV